MAWLDQDASSRRFNFLAVYKSGLTMIMNTTDDEKCSRAFARLSRKPFLQRGGETLLMTTTS